MAVNEMNLNVSAETVSVNRLLGVLGMIGAPMLLLETILRMANVLPQNTDNALVGFVEMIYIGGWIALAFGMRRLRVTGNRLGSKIVFGLQMFGLILAFLFSVQVLFGANFEKPDATLFFKICDLGFPFSHLFMIVIGVMVWRANIWRGWLQIAPFLVGIVLALFMSGLGALVEFSQVALIFAASTAIGLFSLALAVFGNSAKTIDTII